MADDKDITKPEAMDDDMTKKIAIATSSGIGMGLRRHAKKQKCLCGVGNN